MPKNIPIKNVLNKEALTMCPTVNEISLTESESKLWEASRQYMRGEIPLKDLEAVERNYALPPDASVPRSKEDIEHEQSRKYSLMLRLEKLWSHLLRK
jgi:hypothetical protein